jgi:hypothetical protein
LLPVPQGSVVGLLLCSLFIDDLCGAVLTSNYHLYADDFHVNVDVEKNFRWSVENGLGLNSGQIQALIYDYM